MRSRGYLRDPEFARANYGSVRTLIGDGVVPVVPDSVDYSSLTPPPKDQGRTQACVAFSLCRAAHLRATIMGGKPAYPSELATYAYARFFEDPSATMPLVDIGCMPFFACQALTRLGFCAEDLWPFDETKVNDFPPYDAAMASVGHKLTGQYRIDDAGTARCDRMRQALAAGYPLAMALLITDDFENFSGGGELAAMNGPVRGGHDVCVIGYRPGAFLIRNSWGSWGDGGDAWLSDSLISNDANVDDVVAVTAAAI